MDKLYTDYFQKSRAFLYPLIGIRNTITIKADKSYIEWLGKYTKEDYKLCVTFRDLKTEAFSLFEKNIIFKNKLFYDIVECDDDINVYVFTFEDYKEDWNNFLRGKYSRFSNELKGALKRYYGENSPEWEYINSFIYPENFYNIYAKFLTTNERDVLEMENHLKKVGELCSRYNPEQEILRIKPKNL